MITFEQFVTSLGPNAQRYTSEQLRQLHVDVRKMARVLIAIHKTRRSQADRSPQPPIDDFSTDRTLDLELTEPDDGPGGLPAHQP